MDRAQLADFLRTRREALQPEDVGLPRGPRRRTGGLRREEIAALAGMSTDYYARIEQQRSTNLSEPMLAALARALRLSLDERDHLFRLGGHPVPARALRSDHVDPGIMRILDRLADMPAMVVNGLGETLVQTPPAVALLGDQMSFEGLRRYVVYRWFTEPESRAIYPPEDHDFHGRAFTAELREAYTRGGAGSAAAELVATLSDRSEEFARVWAEHEVGVKRTKLKRFRHPEVGDLELYCQSLFDVDQSQSLLVFTAVPGSESAEKVALLGVLGAQRLG